MKASVLDQGDLRRQAGLPFGAFGSLETDGSVVEALKSITSTVTSKPSSGT